MPDDWHWAIVDDGVNTEAWSARGVRHCLEQRTLMAIDASGLGSRILIMYAPIGSQQPHQWHSLLLNECSR